MLHPNEAAIPAVEAKLAEDRLDWRAAVSLWSAHVVLEPLEPSGHLGLARALTMLRRYSAAEGVLKKAQLLFPSNTGLLILSATVATSTASWRHALQRWQAVLRQVPGHPAAAAQIQLCEAKLAEERARDVRLTALFDNFVSLGSNCEFGFVQKMAGSERPSLLRWGYTSHPSLLKALNEGLEGVGTPEQTEIAAVNGQFRIRDRRYGLGQHTFVHVDEAEEDEVFRKQCQRVRLLSQNLIEDLKTGRKIFVYQSPELTTSQALQLQSAMRNHGRNVLLCVRPAPSGIKPGAYHFLADGLMFAYNSHTGLQPDATWDICTGEWVDFCRAAFETWKKPAAPQLQQTAPFLGVPAV